jgi:hypothetical protein
MMVPTAVMTAATVMSTAPAYAQTAVTILQFD